MRARPFNSTAHRTALVLAALLVGAAGASSAVGADAPAEVSSIVFSADSRSAAAAAADEAGLVLGDELVPGRGVYEASDRSGPLTAKDARRAIASLEDIGNDDDDDDDDDDHDKKGANGVKWAVSRSGPSVAASNFYAWPSGRYRSKADGHDVGVLLDLDRVHARSTGAGVRIAVLDTGFDLDHPLLTNRLAPGVDVAEGHPNVGDWLNRRDDNGNGLVDEAHGHGTFVAGMIAQVAPDATVVPIRALEADGRGELFSLLAGIDVAIEADVDVLSLSFGTSEKSDGLEEAIDRATDAGIVVVAAAGNDGSRNRLYPAGLNNVISVAAHDPATGAVADFGTVGSSVDVAAPGVDVVSSRPGGAMGTWSGSSLAAPIVAAQAALLLELHPEWSPEEVMSAITSTASKARGSDIGLINISRAIGS